MKRENRKTSHQRGEEKNRSGSLKTIFFRSSEAEAIEELSMQQNEEVKSKDTKEQANKIVKDLHKTLQTPLTGE